jgi:hypothetical protein
LSAVRVLPSPLPGLVSRIFRMGLSSVLERYSTFALIVRYCSVSGDVGSTSGKASPPTFRNG